MDSEIDMVAACTWSYLSRRFFIHIPSVDLIRTQASNEWTMRIYALNNLLNFILIMPAKFSTEF